MKKIIESLGMSIKEFSTYYEIPYNTVRQWWNGDRTPPKWVIKLLDELINSKKKGEQISIYEEIELAAIATSDNGLKIKRFFENETKRNKWMESYEKAGCKTEKLNLIKI